MSFFTQESYNKRFKLPPPPALYAVGDALNGKYGVKEVLSGGKNSDVYRATDTVSGMEVVVKYIKGSSFLAEAAKKQNDIIRELEKWALLPSHPHVLPLIDSYFDFRIQKFAIVLPYVEATHSMGLTLADLIQNGYPFRAEDVRYLFRKVYQIIAELTQRTGHLYVHKDIRPSNIFIRSHGSDDFRSCDIILADCGSYSSFRHFLPARHADLKESAKDVFMLVETGKRMCPSFTDCTDALSLFCKNLHDQSTILDFEEFFKDTDFSAMPTDLFGDLLAFYHIFSYAIANRKDLLDHFNSLCLTYQAQYKDSVLPMFLTIKHFQVCDRHDEVVKRIRVLLDHADTWQKSYAPVLCSYSQDFFVEMQVRLAISTYQLTDLYSASPEEKDALCRLFAEIPLERCLDLSFLDDAVELCEFRNIIDQNTELLSYFYEKTQALAAMQDDASPQCKRDRRLWKNVFGCMFCADNPEKAIAYAQDIAALTEAEPYHIRYLFYAAKAWMLAGRRAIATVYCFSVIFLVDAAIHHFVQTDKFRMLISYAIRAYYWTGSFSAAAKYCTDALRHIAPSNEAICIPNALIKFSAWQAHIEKEMAIEDRPLNADGDEIYRFLCQKYDLRPYCIGTQNVLIIASTEVLLHLCKDSPHINTQSIQAFSLYLKAIDPDLPLLSLAHAVLYYQNNNKDKAHRAIQDFLCKQRFCAPENPFRSNYGQTEAHLAYMANVKDFLRQVLCLIAPEDDDFIFRCMQTENTTKEDASHYAPQDNDYY